MATRIGSEIRSLLVLDTWRYGSVRFTASIRLIEIGGSAFRVAIEFWPGNDAKVEIPRSRSMALGVACLVAERERSSPATSLRYRGAPYRR